MLTVKGIYDTIIITKGTRLQDARADICAEKGIGMLRSARFYFL